MENMSSRLCCKSIAYAIDLQQSCEDMFRDRVSTFYHELITKGILQRKEKIDYTITLFKSAAIIKKMLTTSSWIT